MTKFKCVIIIFLLALAVRLPGLSDPPKIVFDEVATMTYSLLLLEGRPYFDVHPPLVNLIYSAVLKLNPPKFQNKIVSNDHQFNDFPFVALRGLNAVVGAAVPVVIFLIALEFFGNKLAAMAVGLGAALDNALVIYSRLILPDIWLLFFGLTAVALALRKKWFLTGVFLAAAAGVKWTGLGFWVLTGLIFIQNREKRPWRSLIAAAVVYVLIWLIFFCSLKPGKAFSGIEAFSNRLEYPGAGNIAAILAYVPKQHLLMLNANNLLVKHEAASMPVNWVVGNKKMVFYTQINRTIILLGNLVGWISVIVGVPAAFIMAVWDTRLKTLILGYLANLLPFLLLPRVFFVYHYLPALTIGYVILAGVLIRIKPGWVKLWLGVIVLGFLIIAPVTYGWSAPLWWLKWLEN